MLLLYLYHATITTTTHCIGTACWHCHMLHNMLSMAAYQAHEIVHNAPKMWPDKTVVKGRAETAGVRQRVRERRPISWEEYWSDHLFLPSSSSSELFSQRKKLSDIDRREDAGWNRVKERERKRQMRGWWRHSKTYSSALYSNGTGNRLIIYSHNLSSGVAPKHSITTANAHAAV